MSALLLGLQQPGPENGHRLVAVLELALLVLHRNHHPGGLVGDAHRRVGGVHRLAARARRPVDVHLEVLLFDVYLHLLGFGQHRHGGRRGVYPALRFGDRHPLHPVGAALVLHLAPHVIAPQHEHHVGVAPHVGALGVHHLQLPALLAGEGGVHVEEVAGKQVGLLTPLGPLDLHDHVLAVVGISRGHQLDQLSLQPLGRGGSSIDLGLQQAPLRRVGVSQHLGGRLNVLVMASQLPDSDSLDFQFLVAPGGGGVCVPIGQQLRIG